MARLGEDRRSSRNSVGCSDHQPSTNGRRPRPSLGAYAGRRFGQPAVSKPSSASTSNPTRSPKTASQSANESREQALTLAGGSLLADGHVRWTETASPVMGPFVIWSQWVRLAAINARCDLTKPTLPTVASRSWSSPTRCSEKGQPCAARRGPQTAGPGTRVPKHSPPTAPPYGEPSWLAAADAFAVVTRADLTALIEQRSSC